MRQTEPYVKGAFCISALLPFWVRLRQAKVAHNLIRKLCSC